MGSTGAGPQGGVIGVTSKSKDASIKIYNGRERYNEWAFVYIQTAQRPGQSAGPGVPGGQGGPGQQPQQPGPFGMQPGATPGGRPGQPNGQQPGRTPRHQPSSMQTSSERDAQIREARARMTEEGESRPVVHEQPRRNDGRRPDQRRPQQVRGQSQARSSRPQRWDPRRSEPQYSEPSDHQQPRQPDPARPAPVIQHRHRKTLTGVVGALLGRKPEEEKS